MTVLTPALVNSAYSVGILWYSVCAGRLMEPRIVPPCKRQSYGKSASQQEKNSSPITLTSWSVRRRSTSTMSFPTVAVWSMCRSSEREMEGGSAVRGAGYAAYHVSGDAIW